MPKKIKMGPSAPPLHVQLGVKESQVKEEQVLLNIVTMSNQYGTSSSFVREQHQKILKMLEKKGLIKLKS